MHCWLYLGNRDKKTTFWLKVCTAYLRFLPFLKKIKIKLTRQSRSHHSEVLPKRRGGKPTPPCSTAGCSRIADYCSVTTCIAHCCLGNSRQPGSILLLQKKRYGPIFVSIGLVYTLDLAPHLPSIKVQISPTFFFFLFNDRRTEP